MQDWRTILATVGGDATREISMNDDIVNNELYIGNAAGEEEIPAVAFIEAPASLVLADALCEADVEGGWSLAAGAGGVWLFSEV